MQIRYTYDFLYFHDTYLLMWYIHLHRLSLVLGGGSKHHGETQMLSDYPQTCSYYNAPQLEFVQWKHGTMMHRGYNLENSPLSSNYDEFRHIPTILKSHIHAFHAPSSGSLGVFVIPKLIYYMCEVAMDPKKISPQTHQLLKS